MTRENVGPGARSRVPVVILVIALVAAAAALVIWTPWDYLRTPPDLYHSATGATPARAAVIYHRLGERLPQIKEYTDLWAAEAAMPDAAALRTMQDVIALRPQSPVAYEGHVALARYYALDQVAQAKDEYQAALAITPTLSLRMELARYLEAQGDDAGAYSQYLSALSQMPDAFEGMRRTGHDPLKVAQDLLNATYYNDAVDELRTSSDAAAWPVRAQALAGAGRNAEADAAYHHWLDQAPDNAAAKMGLARVLEQEGHPDEALAQYQAVDSDESRLAQADLLADKHPDQALALYLKSPFPVAWWSATALLEAQKQITETLPVYTKIAGSNAAFADDAAYRLNVLAQRVGDQAAQATARSLLAGMAPDWLAQRAAGGKFSLDVAPPLAPGGQDILAKAQALTAVGRPDLARMELDLAARFQKAPEVVLAMAQALADGGDPVASQRIAASYIADHPFAPLAFWRLSYPQPYAASVKAAAAEYKVDPLLIWAAMRAESRYDPGAVSSVGARGLMQLMPDTQTWIGEQLKADYPPGAAFDADSNIRMGAWYFGYLLQQFKGDMELAIAAYNGGQGSVANWLSDPQVTNRDDWLRWIGFGQTREYLERVELNYQVYQWLEGNPGK